MYEDRVARGAALLDGVRPGWAQEIALDRLAMETCHECILGQLYGDYQPGFVKALARMPADQLFSDADHGFTLWVFEQMTDTPEVLDRFAALADAWRAAIRRRLERKEAP